MPKIIRPGTAIKAEFEGRIRHVIVEEVTDQDNVTVRLGGNSASTEFAAVRLRRRRGVPCSLPSCGPVAASAGCSVLGWGASVGGFSEGRGGLRNCFGFFPE
jgi:hypothetical protein